MRSWREPVSPQAWLASGASATVLVYAIAGAAALGLLERARTGPRLPRRFLTGLAAAAVGDRGMFPMSEPPAGVRPALPRADAESAAVAFGYRLAPTYKVFGGGDIAERPADRRRVCGRSYYVRSVVSVPDSIDGLATATDPVNSWGSAWVVPVCDDAGIARTTVIAIDALTQLRVVLGDKPGDVPELVYPRAGHWHIGPIHPRMLRDWERGIALTPEAAVAAAARQLAGTGARISEVPEAFMTVVAPPALGASSMMNRPHGNTQACPRWRLTLDRDVTLRGTVSGRVRRTRTVYVGRGDVGCSGVPTLQIPRPDQPTTLPYWYDARPRDPNFRVPRRGPLPFDLSPTEIRREALRVTEPIWFEEARPSRPSPVR